MLVTAPLRTRALVRFVTTLRCAVLFLAWSTMPTIAAARSPAATTASVVPTVPATLVHLTPTPAQSALPVEIGDHLFVVAESLGAHEAVLFELRDAQGETVAEQVVLADADGKTPIARLWDRSGVRGCDQQVAGNPWAFLSFAQAEAALLGETFELHWSVVGEPWPIGVVEVTFSLRTRPLLYFSDADGCPKNEIGYHEDLFLSLYGPSEVSRRVFVTLDRPVWRFDDPSFEDALGRNAGLVATFSPAVPTVLVRPSGTTDAGYFAAVVRDPAAPVTRKFLPGDVVLSRPPNDEDDRSTEEGSLIVDLGGGAMIWD